MPTGKTQRGERERPCPLAHPFIRFFSSPLGLTCVNWAGQECCLSCLRPSLQSSSDLPLFYFLGLFPSLSSSHHHSGFLFPILSESENEIIQLCPILCDPTELQPTRLLHPWNFLGKNTGVGCHFLLQGIFPAQGLNLGLPHCRQMLYHLSHLTI